MFTIGIICGGPSKERGISLNSARTLLDHLNTELTQTIVFFVDEKTNFHQINSANLYSNTPSDFDFKIDQIAETIPAEKLQTYLNKCNIIFPVIHGPFGEDGTLQKILEKHKVPFVGSSGMASQQAFLKNNAQQKLQLLGFPTIPFLEVSANTPPHHIEEFWNKHCHNTAIIKPNNAGSSIDVFKTKNIKELTTLKNKLLNTHASLQVQPYCTLREVTIIVIANAKSEPVALFPTETILQSTNTDIFDYRSKYLPTNACQHHTPAHLSRKELLRCRKTAERIFSSFNLSDFARLDGWICPEKGFICYDINLISGFEENSFLFKQSSTCGFTHEETIYQILSSACKRQKVLLPKRKDHSDIKKRPVYIISGGSSSERQVSLMSGRNTWFKLENNPNVQPTPFFLDNQNQIWQLPYALFLHHTVEEIMEDIAIFEQKNVIIEQCIEEITSRLDSKNKTKTSPKKMGLESWAQLAKDNNAFILLALHGGIGENGTIQKLLQKKGIPYNGSDHSTSQVCINKHATIKKIREMNHPDIEIQKQTPIESYHLQKCIDETDYAEDLWKKSNAETKMMIIKPLSDGCSSGIVCICSAKDLRQYAEIILSKCKTAPAHTFLNQPNPIELPINSTQFLLEPYIQTDQVSVINAELMHKRRQGWFELTIVIREKKGLYSALNPSITVSEHAVLSVEEKFQGGTGINLTPPPDTLISPNQRAYIKELACKIGQAVNIKQYARLDIFYNILTNKLQLIEINTLPALTPSTVLFQQALAETPAITPKQFIEQLVSEHVHA